MKTMRGCACAAVVLCAAGVSMANITQVYDASMGTLPMDQGFTIVNIPEPGPAVTMMGDLMHQDTRGFRASTLDAGYQYFVGEHVADDFTQGLEISLRMQVVESSYDPDYVGFGGSNARNAGYGIGGVDGMGRLFSIGITETGLFMDNTLAGDESDGSPFFAFDTTDAVHTYDVSVSAAGILVKIDGSPELSLPLGPTGELPVNFAILNFGDIFNDRSAVPSESVTNVARFAYTILPEPGCALLLVFGAIAMGRRLRG